MQKSWTLVTGGASNRNGGGLGAAICIRLAQEGHAIVCHYNQNESEAKQVVAQCRSFGVPAEMIQGNFTTAASLSEFLHRYQKQFSNTAALINTVGTYVPVSASLITPQAVENLFQTNVQAPLILMQALIESLKKSQGAIINIGVAGLSSERGYVQAPFYMAMKLALLSLTQSFAKELAPFLIRVNMVSPGHLENSIDLPDVASLPMRRAGKGEEVASTVAFLLAKENRYITGQNIDVAGGFGK